MPHLPHSIELHDSRVSGVEIRNDAAVIKFVHAYVHKDGKGWSQGAELTIHSATIKSPQCAYPAKVADGRLKTNLGPYHNLLILPLNTHGPVELEIEFISGEVLAICGVGIEVKFTSEPAFIENVSTT